MEYPYVHGDLLESPQNYQYSHYVGQDFINSWREQRRSLLNHLELSDALVMLERPLLLPAITQGREAAPNRIVLEQLLAMLDTGKYDALDIRKQLAPWVKVFEVRKRLHGTFNELGRPIDELDFRDAPLYLIFASLMEAACSRYMEMPYLNALLKVMDTLTSIAASMNNSEQMLLAWLVLREATHVGLLCERLGLASL